VVFPLVFFRPRFLSVEQTDVKSTTTTTTTTTTTLEKNGDDGVEQHYIMIDAEAIDPIWGPLFHIGMWQPLSSFEFISGGN
jgi:hypothetical protein